MLVGGRRIAQSSHYGNEVHDRSGCLGTGRGFAKRSCSPVLQMSGKIAGSASVFSKILVCAASECYGDIGLEHALGVSTAWGNAVKSGMKVRVVDCLSQRD